MLGEAGVTFDVIVSSTDEDSIKNQISSLPFRDQVTILAKAKAEPVSIQNPNSIVIGGDHVCPWFRTSSQTRIKRKSN